METMLKSNIVSAETKYITLSGIEKIRYEPEKLPANEATHP